MSRRVVGACVLTILCGGAMPAFAQSGHKVGLVMGYPTAAGVLWHVSDGIALRPDFSISKDRLETTQTFDFGGLPNTVTSTTNAWSTSVGVSGLFYLGQPDDLRLYVSPRLAWIFTRNTIESSGSVGLPATQFDSEGYQVSGAFGAQFAPADRFRIFGELGISYSDHQDENNSGNALYSTTITSLSLRSGVGVVIYF